MLLGRVGGPASLAHTDMSNKRPCLGQVEGEDQHLRWSIRSWHIRKSHWVASGMLGCGGCMHTRSITSHSLWPRRVLVLADFSYHWRAAWAKPFHGVTTSYFPLALCHLCDLPSGKWTGQHTPFPHIYGMLRRSPWEAGFLKTILSKDGCRNHNWNSHCGQAQPFPNAMPSKYCESSVIWSLQ